MRRNCPSVDVEILHLGSCERISYLPVGKSTVEDLLTDSSQFKNNYFTEMCSGSEAGSYLRLIDVCITQLQA